MTVIPPMTASVLPSAAALGVPLVTALPASPYDGQTIHYLADAANGIVWPLRYRTAGTTYKWEAIGAGPLQANVEPDVAFGFGSSWGATSGGPSVTVPLAGQYVISHGARGNNPANGVAEAGVLTVKLGSAAAADADAVFFCHQGSGATQSASHSRTMVRTLAAGATLAHYTKGVNNVSTWGYRWITVTPRRVG